MAKIAGHEFVNGMCGCGRMWPDLCSIVREYREMGKTPVNESGIAHQGSLTMTEWNEICTQFDTEAKRFENAMRI